MFSRRKKPAPEIESPSSSGSAALASQMANLSNAFIAGSAEEGYQYDYASENASRLDAWVDLFVEQSPPGEVIHSVIVSMGAYVGELIVRNGRGSWVESGEGEPGLQLGSSDLVCFPLNKVAKRIHVGPEHSIAQFVEVALSGELPQDARKMPPPHL